MTDAVPDDDVAKKLRALQDHYGLTLQDMADRCGLPKRSLENYMRAKKPQRPGLDALRSIADGLDVSVDWLIGRSEEAFAPEFKTEDFALFCHSVVLRLLGELIPLAAADPEAFDPSKLSVNGVDHADIAAAAMLDFMQVVRTQRGNSKRPKGYFTEGFRTISERLERRAVPPSFYEILKRKP